MIKDEKQPKPRYSVKKSWNKTKIEDLDKGLPDNPMSDDLREKLMFAKTLVDQGREKTTYLTYKSGTWSSKTRTHK